MMQAHDFASCYVEERRTRDCIFLEQVGGIWILFCAFADTDRLYVAGTTWERIKYRSHERAFVQSHRTSTRTRIHNSSLLAYPVDKTCYIQDPYFPRMKHGLGWHLKRSRSVGCLRELCPVPEPDEDEELPELHRVNEMDED
jgi:hypothetical protein